MRKGILLALAAALTLSSCTCELTEPTHPSRVEPSQLTEALEPLDGIDESILTPIELSRVSFIAAGDSIIHRGILYDAEKRASDGREFDFRPLFDEIGGLISEADVAFVNQETLMCGEGYEYSFYPQFNSPRQVAYDLIEVGFDVINVANNHMCDKGTDGLRRTLEFWKTLDCVTMIGGYTSAEDYETTRIIEVNGIKIALLGYTEETNGIRLGNSELVVPYTDDETLVRHIGKARESADFVVVSVHWGNENQTTPTDEQRRLASLMASSGADVILGHHPHVLQPIELIENERGTTLCAFSLGNLYAMMATWQNMLGGLLRFELVKMSDGECRLEGIEFIPTVFYYGPGQSQTEVRLLEGFTEADARLHGTGNNYGSRTTAANMREYVASIVGEAELTLRKPAPRG